jgi:uncharacterized membrane protein YdfJ with MMPL/SSD domain
LVIGRDSDAGDMAGALGGDPELSRTHARISAHEGRVMIEDLGSSNGTFVNDRRIDAPTEIHAGDTVRVGSTTLTLQRDDDQATTAARIPTPDATRVRPVVPPQAPAPSGTEPPSRGSGLIGRIAAVADRRPGRVLGVIGVLFVISGVFGIPVAGMMHANNPFNSSSSQSVQVNNVIGKQSGNLPGAQVLALIRTPGGVNAPEARARVTSVAASLKQADSTVASTSTYYTTGNRAFVSRDGSSTYVAVFFKNVSNNAANNAATKLIDAVQKPPEVLLGGPAIANQEIGKQVGMDLGKAEGLAFPILFILDLFVFRGVVAALMPLFVGGVTVLFTFLELRILNSFLPLSNFALNVVIGLGLGLAIDYSLFMVSRYREELAKLGDTGREAQSEALRRATHTAGRTILFSATTVTLAIATLCIIPMPFMYSMGLGGAFTAVTAVLVSLVALPAMLRVLGPRINALSFARWRRAAERSARPENQGNWYRLSHAVMRRPAIFAVGSAVILIALGLPATGIKFIGVDARGVPTGLSARTVNTVLSTQYPTDPSAQITALVKAPPSAAPQITALATQLRSLPGALPAGPAPTVLPGGYFTFGVQPAQDPLASQTVSLVKAIRAHRSPTVEATGTTAQFLDQKSTIFGLLPVVAIVLCVLTAVVLFVMTGSLILPLKSLVMSALSLAAAFGVLVLIFQDGHLQGFLGFKSLHAIDLSQPILIFAVAFGLSSDYTVFLLTRIKEARDAGHSNRDSVAIGLERTGRIVTMAALLFCVAIGAFATSSIVFIKEVGVGIGVAVIIDATLVRALLVPSLMAMLGDLNWWAPGPLRRLHNRIGLRE